MFRMCAFCAAAVRGRPICRACYDLLPWNDVYCERCGQPLSSLLPPGVTCAACQARPPPYDTARAPLRYAFPVDTAIKAMKFRRQLWYGPALAALLLPPVETAFAVCDALVPVPLHRWRQAFRGFNQAAELCRPVARARGLPVVRNVLRRRNTRPQSGLGLSERRGNLRNAFAIDGRLDCRHPLVVDDVITSGETVLALAEVLLWHGADRVSVLAVAHADRFF